MNLFAKIQVNKWILRSLLKSIIFNFSHLPFSQAVKLPILLYKPRLLNNTGKFVIEGPVSFGMIQLGCPSVSLFPNNGIVLENRGTIIFKGRTKLGNNCALSLGVTGRLILGDGFRASTGLKLACYHLIEFERRVALGWNIQIVDTDFHRLTNIKSERVNSGFGPIYVGHDVWIANGCKLYKNVSIPPMCVVGADSILHKAIDCPPYSIITTKKDTIVKTTGCYRNRDNDNINYYEA